MQTIPVETLPNAPSPSIRVGDSVIGEDAIAGEMQFHPSTDREAAAKAAARALVIQELLRQRAEILGIETGSLHEPDERAIAVMLDQELQVPPPDEEACVRFHAAHPERFCEPTRLKVRHILLAAAPDDLDARDEQFKKAEELIETLKQHPKRFDEMAQRFSQCPSKDEGGSLGWVTRGQTVSELDRALEPLPEGLHERPLPSRYGWHVVVIDARLERQPLPYTEVKDRVAHELTEQATRVALRHYLLALESEIGVEGFTLADDDVDGPLMR
ncbi:peptidylprolyl isomerase [Halomonas sp. DN3]|uniref:peptidylprolyl isomerase n=1 Tax=Halomonas sp. DN3 TaxID=2953657 RepID=UPI0020A0C09F|nr:peptidylprolyl isomerase [Halomonas sp. DN3]USZ48243.1 peptidylprolyl isomerase [Halomonas sp. DN3]